MQVRCQSCNKTLQVADQHAGKKVKCPCGAILQVPSSTSVPGTPQSASPPKAAIQKTAVPKPSVATATVPKPAASKVAAPSQSPSVGSRPLAQARLLASAASGAPAMPATRPQAPFTAVSSGGFDSAEVAGLFSGLSDADLKGPTPFVPKAPAAFGTSIAGGQLAGHRVQESEEQKETRARASRHLFQSLGILIF